MENIEKIMEKTMQNLKGMMSTDTVIGKSFKANEDTTIIPISKVTMGFVAGGAEYSETSPKTTGSFPYAGGGSGGMSLVPIAFLAIDRHGYELIKIDKELNIGKWSEILPALVKLLKK